MNNIDKIPKHIITLRSVLNLLKFILVFALFNLKKNQVNGSMINRIAYQNNNGKWINSSFKINNKNKNTNAEITSATFLVLLMPIRIGNVFIFKE